MDNRFVLSQSFNDVVFERRHKEYGAYDIRLKYSRYFLLAVGLAIAAFAGGILLWSALNDVKPVKKFSVISMVLPPDIPSEELNTKKDKEVEKKTVDKVIKSTAAKGSDAKDVTDKIDVTQKPQEPLSSNHDAGKSKNGTEGGTGSGTTGDKPCLDCPPQDTATYEAPKRVEWAAFPPTCDELDIYLQKNIRYPDYCREMGIEGSVYVEFIVDTKGNYSDVKVLKGAHPLLNQEALRVMKTMPKWKPAKDDNGQLVEFIMRKPIRFELAR